MIEEEFEDTIRVNRIRKSKKDRQPKAKRNRTKGQTTISKTYTVHKTKDRVTRTPLKTGDELRWKGKSWKNTSISDYFFVLC